MSRQMMRGSRQEKSLARAFQMDVAGPKKQMLMFPGWDYRSGEGAICIHAARSQDLIDRRTRLLCVERAPAYVPPIVEHLEHLGLTSRTRLHPGELSDLVLAPHERFDFAFFDLEQVIDHKIAFWIAENFAVQMLDGCDISISVELEDHTSVFLKECKLAFRKEFNCHAQAVQDAFKIQDPRILIHLLVWGSIFRQFTFRVHPVFSYNPDCRPMLALKFTNFQRSCDAIDWPSIRDVAEVGRVLRAERIQRLKAAMAAGAVRRNEMQVTYHDEPI